MSLSWAVVDTTGRGDNSSDPLSVSLTSALAAGTGSVSSITGPVAPKGSDIRVARAAELRHELVALVNGRLCVNYENLEMFRHRADVDKPTLVVSLLGDTSVGKSTLVRELIGDGGEDRPFVQRPAEQLSSSTTSNVNIYTSQRILDGYDVHFLDFEGESGSAEPVMGVGGGGPRSARAADSARAAATSALLAAADSGVAGGAGKSTAGTPASAATPAAHGVSPRSGTPGSGSGWHPSPGEASVTERLLHPQSGPSDYVSLAAAVLPSSAVSSASASPFSGAGAAPTPGSAGAAGSGAGTLSPTSAAAHAAAAAAGGGGAGPSILARAQHVRETFPRLAYCVSDLIVLVGASTDCVCRCMRLPQRVEQARHESCVPSPACRPACSCASPPVVFHLLSRSLIPPIGCCPPPPLCPSHCTSLYLCPSLPLPAPHHCRHGQDVLVPLPGAGPDLRQDGQPEHPGHRAARAHRGAEQGGRGRVRDGHPGHQPVRQHSIATSTLDSDDFFLGLLTALGLSRPS